MNDPAKTYTEPTGEAKSSRKKMKVFLPLLILSLPILILWGTSDEEVTVQTTAAEEIVEPAVQESTDEKYRKLIVGDWEMDRDGKRSLTVHSDGTADMDIEVSSSWSFLFGKKLKFRIEWSIENGILTMITTGGEPKGKVDLITSMYGAERKQPIKLLDETTLQLPDEEPGEEDHIWTRVETAVNPAP
ncbi:MAG: hypothetical protein P8M30_11695 [Planctomycetaceae bacterium]|nr:hypothetical protein [Planctomycetaceae bacterium]